MRLGDVAPDFSASTTQGPLTLHAYKRDSWAVLFSHPEDFTPVCTTELGAVARLQREFDARGVKVIGLSCSSLQDHHTWIQDINETQDCSVAFPIIADPTREIAALYDMLDHQDETNVDAAGMPLTVRAVFVLDPRNMVRLMITYPASCGRNFVEILRVIDSLQLTDSRKVATPADWRVGDDVIVHNSLKGDEALKVRSLPHAMWDNAIQRFLFPDMRTVKPYLRFTKI